MKFQRINENVIKCVLTREEMQLRGLNVEELLSNRAKAEEFLQYVLSKARYEMDFAGNGEVLNVQLSVMPDGGVSMMISDDHNAAIRAIAEQFKERLKEFSEVFEKAGEFASKVDGNDFSKEKVINYFISPKSEGDILTYDFWSRLDSIEGCISMAKALFEVQNAESDLYKYINGYYMRVRLSMNKNDIAKNVFVMSEYSDDVSAENTEHFMVREHGDLIIKSNALSELSKLS